MQVMMSLQIPPYGSLQSARTERFSLSVCFVESPSAFVSESECINLRCTCEFSWCCMPQYHRNGIERGVFTEEGLYNGGTAFWCRIYQSVVRQKFSCFFRITSLIFYVYAHPFPYTQVRLISNSIFSKSVVAMSSHVTFSIDSWVTILPFSVDLCAPWNTFVCGD